MLIIHTLKGFDRHKDIHGKGWWILVGVLLGVEFEGVAIGGLVATICHPATDGIPGLPELLGLHLEATHGIFASGEMHFPEFAFRFGIFIHRDACAQEKGKYNPSLQLAYDVAQVFGMKIEEVFMF